MKSSLERETHHWGTLAGETCVGQLAQFFPGAIPMRIPVRLTTLREEGQGLEEQAVIEFGTASEVLFVSTLPLEFDDCVHLANVDGTLDVSASVVAVCYHDGQRAVAVRFATKVANWLIQA